MLEDEREVLLGIVSSNRALVETLILSKDKQENYNWTMVLMNFLCIFMNHVHGIYSKGDPNVFAFNSSANLSKILKNIKIPTANNSQTCNKLL